jgi:hypothetical protein
LFDQAMGNAQDAEQVVQGMMPTMQAGLGVGPYASQAEIENYVRANYGYFAAFMDIPEVGKILYDAAKNGWGENELYGALTKTNWWRSTDAANRTWTKLMSEDPAEGRRLVAQTAASIQNRAASFGIELTPAQISSIALEATRNGWTDEQVTDNLIGQVHWESLAAGDLTAYRDDVFALAGEYLVSMTDATAQEYAKKIASGEMTIDGVRSSMQNQAKARWTWMAKDIDNGVTPSMFFGQPKNLLASELEIGADQINLMDPKWLSIMEKTGEDGKPRAATLTEVQLAARQRPEWQKTNNAQNLTARMINFVSDAFGRSGI